MNARAGQSGSLFLGIDGGGSKCKVVLLDANGQLLAEGLGGPANPLRGMKVATDSIISATQQALTAAGLGLGEMARLVVGAGLAGVNMPQYFRAMQEWQHPFAELHLTTDLHVACIGAHQGQDGAVIIAGTGSCGLASVQGQVLEIGGHGFPYGDNGSGAWFGNQLVHHVLLHHDELGPATLLSALLAEQLGTAETLAIVAHFMHATPTIFAKYAPLVFVAAEQGDAVAMEIVRIGAQHIENMAMRLFHLNPPRLAMIGGLAYKIVPYLNDAVRAKIVDAATAPEYGAVWFAQQQRQNLNPVK